MHPPAIGGPNFPVACRGEDGCSESESSCSDIHVAGTRHSRCGVEGERISEPRAVLLFVFRDELMTVPSLGLVVPTGGVRFRKVAFVLSSVVVIRTILLV